MENRIPLPTDSLYKFCALFGILIVVVFSSASIFINTNTNDTLIDLAIKYETLNSIEERSTVQETEFKLVEKQIEIAVKDKGTFQYIVSGLIVLGLFLLAYGFSKWHTIVQPIQDETARLNLEKLKREIDKLKSEDGTKEK